MVGISALYGDEQIQELVLEKCDEFSMQFIITVKQNCICKIVVRSVHHVRCLEWIIPYAEEKEIICLLTMQLWLFKSNSVSLYFKFA